MKTSLVCRHAPNTEPCLAAHLSDDGVGQDVLVEPRRLLRVAEGLVLRAVLRRRLVSLKHRTRVQFR